MFEDYNEFHEKMNKAIEILDNYLWYEKDYPKEIISDAWEMIREEIITRSIY